ncbi:MAG: hypothetical protein K6A98_03155 [Prevotella sp.]|nr:hypothetical protein [Prevotella sp.]
MSEKSKIRRAERNARQEKQGRKIVAWIFGVLIALGLIFWIVTSLSM